MRGPSTVENHSRSRSDCGGKPVSGLERGSTRIFATWFAALRHCCTWTVLHLDIAALLRRVSGLLHVGGILRGWRKAANVT